MALIPADTLETIRSKTDIAELVAEYVPNLQRAGRNLKGRCPFHQERTPSFIVSPERQTFHCFGCGEGGDCFSFVMKIEGLGFGEAAERLADRAGVRIQATESLGPEQKERLKLKEILDWAAGFYQEALRSSRAADAARQYVARRKLNDASVAQFQLGYAPGGSQLLEAGRKKGFAQDQIAKAGLVTQARSGGLRDYFYERLMFPIRDAKGACVGFGARTLGDGEPKYLNSADSPAFSKGRVLYGLYQGLQAVRKEKRALLMEGYMDVIAAHQYGVLNACAPLGTALTPEQAGLLRRYADEAVIVFDADSAGLNAAVRGAEVALAAGLGVRIATVPEGKDPDEFLHGKGAEAFRAALAPAKDLVEFRTELLLSREPRPLSPQSKAMIAKLVLSTIEQAPDEVLKDEWIRRLAQRLGVGEEALRKGLNKATSTSQRFERRETTAPLELSLAELNMLVPIVRKPELVAGIAKEAFGPLGQRVLGAIGAAAPWSEGWTARMLDALEPAQRAAATALVARAEAMEGPDDPDKVPRDSQRRVAEARLADLKRSLHEGKEVDWNEFNRLSVELKGSRSRHRGI